MDLGCEGLGVSTLLLGEGPMATMPRSINTVAAEGTAVRGSSHKRRIWLWSTALWQR